jgi:hypothetical protein
MVIDLVTMIPKVNAISSPNTERYFDRSYPTRHKVSVDMLLKMIDYSLQLFNFGMFLALYSTFNNKGLDYSLDFVVVNLMMRYYYSNMDFVMRFSIQKASLQLMRYHPKTP